MCVCAPVSAGMVDLIGGTCGTLPATSGTKHNSCECSWNNFYLVVFCLGACRHVTAKHHVQCVRSSYTHADMSVVLVRNNNLNNPLNNLGGKKCNKTHSDGSLDLSTITPTQTTVVVAEWHIIASLVMSSLLTEYCTLFLLILCPCHYVICY